MNADARKQFIEILEIAAKLKDEKKIQDILLNVLRAVGPSRLNRDQNGEQKTITYGGVKRMVYSAASKKTAMIDMIPRFKADYLQTKKIDEFIAERYTEAHPETTNEEKEQVKKWVASMFKGKDSGDKEGKIPVIIFGKSDIDGILKVVDHLVDHYGFKPLKDDVVKKEKIAIDPEMGRSPSPYIAMNGSFGKEDLLFKFRSAIKMSMPFSVTEYYGESDGFVAQDHLEDAGAGHIDTKDCNTAVMYESILIAPIIYIINRMWGRDYHNEAVWDEVIEECKQVVKDLMKAFITSVPSSDQHNYATHSAPIAVCAKVGTVQMYTAEEHYLTVVDPDRVEDDAINRLLAYIDDDVFDEHDEERYWLEIKKGRVPELETVHVEKKLSCFIEDVLSNIGG